MSKFSYSKVSCYKSCPYKYQLRYIDKLETLPNYDANNALHLGSCMHTGLEKGVKAALAQYYTHFPLIDDLQVNEAMKLEYIIPLAKKVIPAGHFEVKIETDGFKGFMDLLVPKGNNHFDLYDFKYSNNVESYLKSVQLHVYKYYYELTHPGHVIDNMYYLFLPKIQIRQKKTEDLFQFRKRLLETLERSEVSMFKVEYDPQKVEDYLAAVEEIKAATQFPKNCTRLCDWCEYKEYCQQGDTTMITMPKIERRKINGITKKRIWLYGKPMTGKTYFANQFPEPLMLNTDGNTQTVDATVIRIVDQVETINGRVKKTPAWQFFGEVVDMLEREQNNPERPKTIIVDVLDHLLAYCREVVFEKHGITHESDAGFGKGFDLVRTPYFNNLKRLNGLDYETIIFISHENDEQNVTKRDGSNISKFAPTLPAKVANQLAGIVDLTGRVYIENGVRYLQIPKDNLYFGGFRYAADVDRIPLTYEALMSLYANALPKDAAPAEKPVAQTPASETAPAAPAQAQTTTRRRVAAE